MPATQPITVYGDPRLPPYFWERVQPTTDGCWIWMGCLNIGGYGQILSTRHPKNAHRTAYQSLVGPITSESMDHLCRVRCCVNPAHLEQVSQRENVRRGNGLSAVNATKEFCLRGHPLFGPNMSLDVWRTPERRCKECGRIRTAAYRRRLEERAKSRSIQ